MSHSKMDTNRALGIMGFGNLRWLDPSTGMDPKQALDKALFEKTQKLCASRSNGQTKQVELHRISVKMKKVFHVISNEFSQNVAKVHLLLTKIKSSHANHPKTVKKSMLMMLEIYMRPIRLIKKV